MIISSVKIIVFTATCIGSHRISSYAAPVEIDIKYVARCFKEREIKKLFIESISSFIPSFLLNIIMYFLTFEVLIFLIGFTFHEIKDFSILFSHL